MSCAVHFLDFLYISELKKFPSVTSVVDTIYFLKLQDNNCSFTEDIILLQYYPESSKISDVSQFGRLSKRLY